MLRYYGYTAKTVSQWTLTFSIHNYICYQNMLHIAHYSEFELYLPDGHCEAIASKPGEVLPV